MSAPIGEWKRPQCGLCGAVIEASIAKPPMFVLEAGVWVHWGCWKRARVRVRPGVVCVKSVPSQQELL